MPHSLMSKHSIAEFPGLTVGGYMSQLVHVTDGRITFPLPNFCFVLNQQLSHRFFKAFLILSLSLKWFSNFTVTNLHCALLCRNFSRDSWELSKVLDWCHSHVWNIKLLFSNISSAKLSFSLLWGLWKIQLVKIVHPVFVCMCMCVRMHACVCMYMCMCIWVCMFVCAQACTNAHAQGGQRLMLGGIFSLHLIFWDRDSLCLKLHPTPTPFLSVTLFLWSCATLRATEPYFCVTQFSLHVYWNLLLNKFTYCI